MDVFYRESKEKESKIEKVAGFILTTRAEMGNCKQKCRCALKDVCLHFKTDLFFVLIFTSTYLIKIPVFPPTHSLLTCMML